MAMLSSVSTPSGILFAFWRAFLHIYTLYFLFLTIFFWKSLRFFLRITIKCPCCFLIFFGDFALSSRLWFQDPFLHFTGAWVLPNSQAWTVTSSACELTRVTVGYQCLRFAFFIMLQFCSRVRDEAFSIRGILSELCPNSSGGFLFCLYAFRVPVLLLHFCILSAVIISLSDALIVLKSPLQSSTQ